MDPVTLVMYLENPDNIPDDMNHDDIMDAIREHKEALRVLQGSYGRMIENLESMRVI